MQCIAEMFVCVSKAIFVCLYLEADYLGRGQSKSRVHPRAKAVRGNNIH